MLLLDGFGLLLLNALEMLHLRVGVLALELLELSDGSMSAARGLRCSGSLLKLLESDGRRAASNLGEFCALEFDVSPVEGRYDSQSLGSGGTGGMYCAGSPPATSLPATVASCVVAGSPVLWVEDTSLPTLPRLFLSEADRAAEVVVKDDPEMDVPDVESREPDAEVDVPAVRLAEEEDPRLNGAALGKGTSYAEDEPGRGMVGTLLVCGETGERFAEDGG